ncbi:hypothetical protein ACNKHR_21775 [Shigella flexneri]
MPLVVATFSTAKNSAKELPSDHNPDREQTIPLQPFSCTDNAAQIISANHGFVQSAMRPRVSTHSIS